MENTVSSLLNKTSSFFEKKKIRDHRFHAEQLLSRCLGIDRIQLYMQLERPLESVEIDLYRKQIKEFKEVPNQKTIKEIIDLSIGQLNKKNVPEAEISTRYIIAHHLKIKPIELALHYNEKLSIDDLQFIRNMLRRRIKREPIQYILGETEFYGYPIKVNRSVLIPRPETEFLVEEVLRLVHSDKELQGLDIGTGTACISIAVSKENPLIKMTAVDISRSSLSLAERNANRNKIAIDFIQMDFLDESQRKELLQYDFIVSNPPYIGKSELSLLEDEVIKYEPHLALSDNSDGLEFYRVIIDFARFHLKGEGYLFFEIGAKQKEAIIQIAKRSALFSEMTCKTDLSGFDRVIYMKRKK